MSSMVEDAEYFRLAMVAGLLPPQEVISWADSTVARLDEPPLALIDLSLGSVSDPHQMSRRLGILATGDAGRDVAARRVFRLLHDQLFTGELSHRQVVSALDILGREANGLSESEAEFLSWVGDEFELVDSGYKEMGAAERELEHFLGGYAATTLDA